MSVLRWSVGERGCNKSEENLASTLIKVHFRAERGFSQEHAYRICKVQACLSWPFCSVMDTLNSYKLHQSLLRTHLKAPAATRVRRGERSHYFYLTLKSRTTNWSEGFKKRSESKREGGCREIIKLQSESEIPLNSKPSWLYNRSHARQQEITVPFAGEKDGLFTSESPLTRNTVSKQKFRYRSASSSDFIDATAPWNGREKRSAELSHRREKVPPGGIGDGDVV